MTDDVKWQRLDADLRLIGPIFTRDMVERARWTKPDLGYRRSVVRLRAACHLAAFAAFLVSLVALAWELPFAGILAAVLAFFALRLAAEVRQEIEGWRRRSRIVSNYSVRVPRRSDNFDAANENPIASAWVEIAEGSSWR